MGKVLDSLKKDWIKLEKLLIDLDIDITIWEDEISIKYKKERFRLTDDIHPHQDVRTLHLSDGSIITQLS